MTTDREKAMFALFPELANRMPGAIEALTFSEESEAQMAAVEALLAEERAKARAPFMALAQELATVATDHHATVAGDAYADAADRIIAVLEGTYL